MTLSLLESREGHRVLIFRVPKKTRVNTRVKPHPSKYFQLGTQVTWAPGITVVGKREERKGEVEMKRKARREGTGRFCYTRFQVTQREEESM